MDSDAGRDFGLNAARGSRRIYLSPAVRYRLHCRVPRFPALFVYCPLEPAHYTYYCLRTIARIPQSIYCGSYQVIRIYLFVLFNLSTAKEHQCRPTGGAVHSISTTTVANDNTTGYLKPEQAHLRKEFSRKIRKN